MTPIQTQRQQADPFFMTVADDPALMTVLDDLDDAPDASGPRVWDDMTVEVALSVMAGARVECLLLCDGDDQCTGSITRAELAVHRGSSTYTDRVRLRDVLDGRPRRSLGPSPSGSTAGPRASSSDRTAAASALLGAASPDV